MSGEKHAFVENRRDGPGVARIDSGDPAAPLYRLLAKMRSPVSLRDLMIRPVREGYIGNDRPLDPADLPPSAAVLYPDVTVTERAVPTPAGAVRCQVFASPGGSSRAIVLYLHGGGFTLGASEDTAYITSRIAAETGLAVVSANYRLAPEWPFPAALDDSLAVLRWLRSNGKEIGGNPGAIFVAGDSAGANLAAALPLKARDESVEPPEAALLFAPITDFLFEEHDSFERLAPLGIVYDSAFMGFIRGAYAVHRRTWSHPHVSPARGDLVHYPPTLIITGTANPLIDDNRSFAAKLSAAGRSVEHFTRPGMPPGFYFFPGLFAEGDEAFAAATRFLNAAS